MATKKSKRSTSTASSKKSTKPESTKQTKIQAAKVKDEVVEEVVEVVEIEAPVKETKATKKGLTITDKLAALNPAALIAELIGSFILAAAFIQLVSNTSFGLVALALVVIALVIAFIGISGAHLNPAITIAQWINRKINGVKAVSYIVAQVLGAILAFFVLTGITKAGYDYTATVKRGVANAGITEEVLTAAGGFDAWAETYGGIDGVAAQLGITKEAPELYQYDTLTEGKEWVAMLAELLGAVILGLGAGYAYSNRKNNKVAAGVAMGVALIAGLLIGGAGTILNPAIATTMGVFTWGSFTAFLWPILVYVISTIAGVTLGFFVYQMLVKDEQANAKAIED